MQTFSYTIPTGKNSKLAFGIKGGFTSYSLDADFQQSQAFDPVIFGFEDRWKPNIGTGVYWHSQKWYVRSFSSSHIKHRLYW